jgi:hypothetical protein
MSAESEILFIKKSFSITPPEYPPLTVGEDFFFIYARDFSFVCIVIIKRSLRLLPYHISFVEKFQQKYTVSQVVKKHPYLCTMN